MQKPLTHLFLALSCSFAAAQESKPLEIQAESNHVIANALEGEWTLDEGLTQRLGRKGGETHLKFTSDPAVLEKVPAKIAALLAKNPIYFAGTMVKRDVVHGFLLTIFAGNPTIIWFRERDGDPYGDIESWNVSVARGDDTKDDILFIGGDRDNQPFTAFARAAAKPSTLTASAALNDIIRLLEAGKASEFVKTYCAPDDLIDLRTQGRTIESLASRFQGERGETILAHFNTASKEQPTMNEEGDEATWAIAEGPGPQTLRLKRINGRWYIQNN